jgi:maltooligosyltrehalose trehalohydrolase
MPVNSFPGRWGWGYDGTALYAPQQQYGGPEELKRFVNACHAHGMAALLDVVYNHFGPVGNYTGRFGPYITENHHTPWGGAVNLEEAGSTEVRRFFCDNALMWLHDYHFDGLRLDAVQTFVDRSAIHFLEQLATEASNLSNELNRKLVLVAESDLNDPRLVTPRVIEGKTTSCECGGYGIDAQWSDDFHHALFALLSGTRTTYYRDFGSLAQLVKSLTSVYVYDGIYSHYRNRVHGRPAGSLDGHRFLGYIQNHDQAGNRPLGDRSHSEAGFGKAKLAAAMVLCAPYVPMIFQGEEWAASSPFLYFADHEDPELARAVSEGRRREHADEGLWDTIPDPESEEAFSRSKLRWDERSQPGHAAMLEWYRSLIQFRMAHLPLLSERINESQVEFDEASNWLLLKRGPMRLFFNFSEDPVSQPVSEGLELLLTSEADVRCESERITLPPASFAAGIYRAPSQD